MNYFSNSRNDSDEELNFVDLDETKAIMDHDVLHTAATEKKVDADFNNAFEDDFDEADMKRTRYAICIVSNHASRKRSSGCFSAV